MVAQCILVDNNGHFDLLLKDEIMRAKGFTKKGWITRSFPGEEHFEKSWAKRLSIPLEFPMKK